MQRKMANLMPIIDSYRRYFSIDHHVKKNVVSGILKTFSLQWIFNFKRRRRKMRQRRKDLEVLINYHPLIPIIVLNHIIIEELNRIASEVWRQELPPLKEDGK